MIWTLKKFQMCYGGKLTMLLPECHENQASWSLNDKILFDKVRQFILELVRSFGCQATRALSLTDNLTWTECGSPHFNPDYLHARNSFYMQHLLVHEMVPTTEWQYWWSLELTSGLMSYLHQNINPFDKEEVSSMEECSWRIAS